MLYIALQNVAAFRANWLKLADQIRATSSKNKVALITTKEPLKSMQIKNIEEIFDLTIVVKEFDFMLLKREIEYLKEFYNIEDYNDIRLVVQDEFSLLLVSQIRKELQIPGDTVQEILPSIDKIVMKETVVGLGFKVPSYVTFDKSTFQTDSTLYVKSLAERMRFPLFVKPIDGAASIGTKKILNEQDLYDWIRSKDKIEEFEIEEFIDGNLYHCDSIVQNGQIVMTQVLKYNKPNYYYTQGYPLGSILLNESHNLFDRLKSYSTSLLRKMIEIGKLPQNTVTHLEVFHISDTDELIFLEINSRAPGGIVSSGFQKRWGLHLEEIHLLCQMNLNFGQLAQSPLYSYAWVYYPNKEGTVKNINPLVLRSESEVLYNLKVNQKVNKSIDVMNTSCKVLIYNKSSTDLQNDFEYLVENYEPYDYKEME